MIKSMTAFARAETVKDALSVVVEIRAYNSRHLDLVFRVAHPYIILEKKVKELISDWVSRGRLEVSLNLRDASEDAYHYEVNLPKARAYHRALEHLKRSFDVKTGISLELLVGAGDLIIAAEFEKNPDNYWPVIQACLHQALTNLDEMRRQEGQFLAKDLTRRLNYINHCIFKIEKESGGLMAQYQERLKDRIAVLTRGLVELDSDRIVQEAALLADRSDISEEIVRASSHVEQFRKSIESDEPAGRKLIFIVQELNREINTIGSKTGKAQISHIVVEVKTELEKIREQVQNIE